MTDQRFDKLFFDFDRQLDRYAELIVKVGLNLQQGQRLLIGAPIFDCFTPLEAAPLVRQITKHAYQQGARLVDVIWGDQELHRIRLKNVDPESLTENSEWPVIATKEFLDRKDALLLIFAADPDLFAGLDNEAVTTIQSAWMKRSASLMEYVARNSMNWVVAAAAVPGWASKVFPGLPEADSVARLWESIFEVCRMNQPDPVAAWEAHIENLLERCAYLNSTKYSALHFTAPGTDLAVGLPQAHLWLSGQLCSENGIPFIANLPTEEIFTMPHKDQVNGVVAATKPLSYGGALIEGMRLVFKDGKVVEAHADRGQELLDGIITADVGASQLGEIALVQHDSPISQSGLLFYNILIDENASNHMALGHAYQFSLEGGTLLSEEQFAAIGGNLSQIHIDFMIGSGDMDVDGITDTGASEAIMRSGSWAF